MVDSVLADSSMVASLILQFVRDANQHGKQGQNTCGAPRGNNGRGENQKNHDRTIWTTEDHMNGRGASGGQYS